ncbi:hypothetical protein [Domibacillus robiginosus]|uniref:hypothetical protein n=1 Tax=Domibacillus robiginosus TaxID=1071054 RepID=UPI0012E09E40|nr:hypothetical protein [Domibacillus robiginosus]
MKNGLVGLLLLAECVLAVLFIVDFSLLFERGWLAAGFVAAVIVIFVILLAQFKKQLVISLILSIGTLFLGLGLLGAMEAFYGFARIMGG